MTIGLIRETMQHAACAPVASSPDPLDPNHPDPLVPPVPTPAPPPLRPVEPPPPVTRTRTADGR